MPVLVSGFIGRGVGSEIKDLLESEGLKHCFIPIKGSARISVTASTSLRARSAIWSRHLRATFWLFTSPKPRQSSASYALGFPSTSTPPARPAVAPSSSLTAVIRSGCLAHGRSRPSARMRSFPGFTPLRRSSGRPAQSCVISEARSRMRRWASWVIARSRFSLATSTS